MIHGNSRMCTIDGVPEALNETNNTIYSEHLQVKLFGQKGDLGDTPQLLVPVKCGKEGEQSGTCT